MIVQIPEQYLRRLLDVAKRSRKKPAELQDAITAAEASLGDDEKEEA